MESKVHLIDCVEFMQGLPDKAFDLAIVDPPYGIGVNMNAGRKSAFNEPTKTVSFRCPLSKTEELKLYVTAKLSEWSQGGI